MWLSAETGSPLQALFSLNTIDGVLGRQAFGEGDAELAFIPSPDAFDE